MGGVRIIMHHYVEVVAMPSVKIGELVWQNGQTRL